MVNQTTITISKKDLEKVGKLQEKVNSVFRERHKIEKAFTRNTFFSIIVMYIEEHIEGLIEELTMPEENIEKDPSFVWSKTEKID